jgi:DNA-binding MarR family transcriptional regulator
VTFRTRALERATHDLDVYLQEVLRDVQVTQAEIHVLGYLADSGPATVGEIHGSFGHRRSTLSSVLNRLEHRALIARSINPDDRRSIVVTLTATGATTATRVREVIRELEGQVAATATPAEQAGFSAVLAALGDATRRSGAA